MPAFIGSLFLALKAASVQQSSPWVFIEDIANMAATLASKHLISASYGNTTSTRHSSLPAKDYFIDTLDFDTLSDHPTYWQDSKDFIKTHLDGATFRSGTDASGKREFSIIGLNMDELLILI